MAKRPVIFAFENGTRPINSHKIAINIFEAQSIRAKIHVRMCKNYKLIFYIPYKSLMEDLEKSIQQAKTIYDNVRALGTNTTFNRVGYYDKFIENQI